MQANIIEETPPPAGTSFSANLFEVADPAERDRDPAVIRHPRRRPRVTTRARGRAERRVGPRLAAIGVLVACAIVIGVIVTRGGGAGPKPVAVPRRTTPVQAPTPH